MAVQLAVFDSGYRHKYISDIIGQPTGTGLDLTRRGGGPVPHPCGFFIYTHTHTHTYELLHVSDIEVYLIKRLQHCILGISTRSEADHNLWLKVRAGTHKLIIDHTLPKVK